MWKIGGVLGLWVALVAGPHVGSSGTEVSLLGPEPGATIPDEDPGNPYRLKAEPARRELPGSFATIHLKNELGKTLRLAESEVTWDGRALPVVTNLATDGDAVVFAGRVAPGPHALATHLVCQGKRRGPFTYLKDYKWDVRTEASVTVPEDRATVVTISAVRRKGVNVPFDQQVEVVVHDSVVPHPLSLGGD